MAGELRCIQLNNSCAKNGLTDKFNMSDMTNACIFRDLKYISLFFSFVNVSSYLSFVTPYNKI